MIMYPFPAGYNPHHPRQQPPKPAEIPEAVKRAAREAGASHVHVGSDGITAYMWRLGKLCWADWDGAAFASWWSYDDEVLPCGVVSVDG